MRLPLRMLPAIALLTTGLARPASASDSCTYYWWEQGNQRWIRVAVLVNQNWYENETGHQQGVDWHCHYCYFPSIVGGTGGGGDPIVAAARDTVAHASATVTDATGIEPGQYQPGQILNDVITYTEVYAGPVGPQPGGYPPCPSPAPPEPAFDTPTTIWFGP